MAKKAKSSVKYFGTDLLKKESTGQINIILYHCQWSHYSRKDGNTVTGFTAISHTDQSCMSEKFQPPDQRLINKGFWIKHFQKSSNFQKM